jgi:hypothetical protein
MARAPRNEKSAILREIRGNLLTYGAMTTETSDPYEIHAEAHGAHWIAWVTRGAAQKPARSIVFVAANEAEARDRARRSAEQGAT